MSQIAIVNMKVQPGKYEEAVAFMQKHIPDTASFEGCGSIRVAGSLDGSTMMVYGEWTSIEAHKKYVAWREENGLLQEFVSDFLESPPEFLYQSQVY